MTQHCACGSPDGALRRTCKAGTSDAWTIITITTTTITVAAAATTIITIAGATTAMPITIITTIIITII